MIHTTSIASGKVTGAARRFSEADIPGVVELYRRARHPQKKDSPELVAAYRRYLARVFLDELWDGSGVSSLVYQDGDGAISGFLGVVPRWMSLDGARCLAAVSSRLLVDERRRGDVIAAELSKGFLRGPQDLSISDGVGDAARAPLAGLGGRVAHVHSLRWSRVLRPVAFFGAAGAAAEGRRISGRAVAGGIGRWLPGLRRSAPALVGEEMCPGTLVEQLPALVGPTTLRPDDDERTARWALERVAAQPQWARTAGVLLRDSQGRAVGAYHHALDAEGVDHVLQLVAAPSRLEEVIEHVLHSAFEQGATAVEGRADWQLTPELMRSRGLTQEHGPRVLVHMTRGEIRAAFERGAVVFSRMQGEACLRFPEPAEGPLT